MTDAVKGETCPDCGRPRALGRGCDADACCFSLLSAPPEARRNWWRTDCYDLTIARLRRELASAKQIGELERAVVEACVAERAARDAIPAYRANLGEMKFPPKAFWDASAKLEAAHVVYETRLDALLAARASAEKAGA